MSKLNFLTVIILIISIIRNCINIITSIIKYNVDNVLFIVDEVYYNIVVSDIITGFILIFSFILILRLNKWGYYLFLLTNVSFIIALCSIGGDILQNITFSVINIILCSLLLLLKKDGMSGFAVLEFKPSFKTMGNKIHSIYDRFSQTSFKWTNHSEDSVTNNHDSGTDNKYFWSNILILILILILFSLFYITIK